MHHTNIHCSLAETLVASIKKRQSKYQRQKLRSTASVSSCMLCGTSCWMRILSRVLQMDLAIQCSDGIECYIFIRHQTIIISYHLIFPYLDLLPLIICRLHQTVPFLSLIPYPLYRRSSLVLSSGWSLIALSVSWRLSCTIHRLTKWWYCRPWTMSPLPCHFTCSSPPAVYKMYYYSTWTLSLSFHVIKTSEPDSKELKLVDFPVSLLSAAA